MEEDKTGIEEFTDSFSQDEIIQEYKKLLERYKHLKSIYEDDQQKIYELKRNCETAAVAESYLSQELELLTASQSAEIEKVQEKYQLEIDDLKRKLVASQADSDYWQRDAQSCRDENVELQEKIKELESIDCKEHNNTTSGSMERELQLAKENLELLAKIDELRDKITSSIMAIAERDRQMEILKEQIECLEENLQAKREEVDEKTQLLESSQERAMELSAELALLKSTPENMNRKGNSLFAEVDDQRQQMKRILAAQKKHYMYMKKCYNESEQEIRRLKRENAAMHKEMQVCATIFLSADKRYKEKLNQRILQQLKQNEDLEKKLIWTQERLVALSLDKGINWLDSMLAFCKTETEEIKEQLRSVRIEKGILEENLHKSQQELAKWRFEALKSRCIIIDRETLLEENKINFKAIEFRVSEGILEKAQPQIFTTGTTKVESSQTPKGANNPKTTDIAISVNESIVDLSNTPESNSEIKNENIGEGLKSEDLQPRPCFSSQPCLLATPTSSRKCSYPAVHIDISPSDTKDNPGNHAESISSLRSSDAETSALQPGVKFKTDLSNTAKNRVFGKTPFKKKQDPFDDESETPKESKSFEIYEDTVCRIPVIRCTNVDNLLENPPSKQSETLENKPFAFEIYEDTVCRLPAVTKDKIEDVRKENIPRVEQTTENKKENSWFSDSLNYSSPVLVEHNEISPTHPHPILVKNRSIFDDLNENKTVTFSPELTTEIKDEKDADSEPDVKAARSKSQVVVKRIVVKSNFNKKQ